MPQHPFDLDLPLARLRGEVEDHADCHVLRWPDCPASLRHNAVLLRRPPKSGDAGAWLARARQMLPDAPHTCLQWVTGEDEAPEAFGRVGFRRTSLQCWVAPDDGAGGVAQAQAGDVELRALHTPDGLDARDALHARCRAAEATDARAENEGAATRAAWRRWHARGEGAWWGAWRGGRLVGAVGLLDVQPDHTRILGLGVAPDARGQGLGRALLAHAQRQASGGLSLLCDPLSGLARLARQMRWRLDHRRQVLVRGRPGLGLRVRPAAAADRDLVGGLHRAAFPTPGEAFLVDTLWNEPGSLSLVAEQDGVLVGHVLFTEVQVVGARRWTALALGPVAVRPSRQRAGIGTELLQEGLRACQAAGHPIVFVLGDPEFYGRLGFRSAAERGLSCAFDAPEGAFGVWLAPGAAAPGRGQVRHHPAFHALD